MIKNLYILPSAPAFVGDKGCWIDEKMYDGLRYFLDRWDGSVFVFLKNSKNPILFNRINIRDAKFDVSIYEDSPDLSIVDSDDVILASADDYSQLSLPYKYPSLKRNIVFILENTFNTRLRIILSERRNILKKIGGIRFLIKHEYAIRRALKNCGGLQANGYPAFLKYKKYCKNSIFYFDTRLEENVGSAKEGDVGGEMGILRLAYSGRLTKIKGSNFLIPLARILDELGVSYIFKIYGDGELFESMKNIIVSENLSNRVLLMGAVDYKKVLVPCIRDEIDLFVMPHVQGDPSCTYFETLALGVPIIGFDNEAWSGILNNFGEMGWSVRSGDVKGMAQIINNLWNKRDIIIEKSDFVKKMAGGINFQSQFKKRLKQLSSI